MSRSWLQLPRLALCVGLSAFGCFSNVTEDSANDAGPAASKRTEPGTETAEVGTAYSRAASYGDDAARTPWRVVTDYLWNGTPAAKRWTDRVTQWVAREGIQNAAQWYNLDGSADTEASTWDDHTAINVGPWAAGAMSHDQAHLDAFASELLAIPADTHDHDGEYFPRMLKALALSTLVGKFTMCGGAGP